jgi:hypothetical protein
LFESPLTDMLVNVGTTLAYITGLIGFVMWLERSKAKPKANVTETY